MLPVLLASDDPTRALALALLRMMADAGVSQDVATWDLLTPHALREIFGIASCIAFEARYAQVWPEMKRIAPLLERWP